VSPRHPEHLDTFDYVGPYRYSLRFSTDSRQRRFTTADVVELVLSHFLQQSEETHFAVVVYCFMPDHVHLLIEGTNDDSDCKQFIKRAKQFSGFYFAKQFSGTLWQRYGYERVLRDDESTFVVANYILSNPVRAGLVQDIRDYAFVGSSAYSLDELLQSVCRSG